MLSALIALEGDYYVIDEETGAIEKACVWSVADELGVERGAYAVKTAAAPRKGNALVGAVLISVELWEFLLECFGKIYLKWNYYDDKPFRAIEAGQGDAENERIREAILKTYGSGLAGAMRTRRRTVAAM